MAACDFGFVYFLDAPSVNRIKIGTAIEPEHRVTAVRLMSPVEIRLIGTIAGGRSKEAELHERFRERRAHGEWFDADADFRGEIQRLLLMDIWQNIEEQTRSAFMELIEKDDFGPVRTVIAALRREAA